MQTLPPFNFCGLEGQSLEKSRFAVLAVPYDSTSFYRSGTRDAPHEIIKASRYLELFDAELKCSPFEAGIFTFNELLVSRHSTDNAMRDIESAVSELLEAKKFPVLLGGEHSITIGSSKAFAKRFKNLSILQLDAHADLRDSFFGTPNHHGCTMRRCMEVADIVQVGIRSYSDEEAEFIEKEKPKIFFGNSFDAKKVLDSLKEDVYLTFDFDAFDPAVLPAVSTPEPNGLQWQQVIDLLSLISKKKNLVGADFVELCPIAGQTHSEFLAASLIYKIIGLKYLQEKKR